MADGFQGAGQMGQVVVLVATLLLAACGDDEAAPPEDGTRDPGWSAPAEEHATGSPDGTAPQTAEALLARLRARIAEGRGPAVEGFDRDVEAVAAVLWDPEEAGSGLTGAQAHVQTAAIAGEMAQWFHRAEDARQVHERRDPTAVALHDAWLEAAAGGPEAYVAWCEGEGADLLRKRAQALHERFFPAKR